MDEFIVFFENKTVVFGRPDHDVAGIVMPLGPGEVLAPANLLKILENTNTLHLTSNSPEDSFRDFSAQFIAVEAAGGIVENAQGDILMMKRKGWWDLPKGHVEEGESTLQAALREVEEETGLSGATPGELIATTWHFYNTYNRWELKRTWWYAMKYNGGQAPQPQAEEGITEVCWLGREELDKALTATYSTIRYVFGEKNGHGRAQ